MSRMVLAGLVVVAVSIILLASVGMASGPPSGLGVDKAAHFLAYAVLAALLALLVPRGWWLAVALGAAVLGVALEAAQEALPGREASLADAVANAAGAVAGAALAGSAVLRRRWSRSR